ncbi:hypothetical protein RRG08_026177 [Elysia crispata]|uniref:Tyrosine-protein kinase receptor n=1 Tax=Elysia crispata TaxID=231223 RepID=A0AAE0ZBM7_9GAST|nr:hypothetical protein RRG08_026177 [Elysia crispata]
MEIQDAVKVTSIYIEGQPQLTHLEDGTFRNFTQLTNLTIKGSGLTQLDKNVFENSRSLQYLNLENNRILDFPDSILNNTNVTEVLLQNNPLKCQCSNSWLLKPSSLINISHSLCTSGGQNKTIDEINQSFLEMLKQCEPTRFPQKISVITVSKGEKVTITCPLRNMNITWDMVNIQSEWQLKTPQELGERNAEIEILDISETDQCRVVTCKGRNSTLTAEANFLLSIPSKPSVRFVEFYGTGYTVSVHLNVVGWPLPSVRWEIESTHRTGVVNTTLNNISPNGSIEVWLEIHPVPAHDTMLEVVVTNNLGSDQRRGQIVISKIPAASHVVPHIPEIVDSEPATNNSEDYVSSVSKDSQRMKILLSIGIGGLCMVTLLVISIIIKCRDKIRCYKKWKFFKMKSLGAYDLAARVDDMSLQDVMVDNPMYKGLYSSASVRKISSKNICKRRLIGEGNFGLVFLGECANLERSKSPTTVAIKTLKGDSSASLRRDFEREAELLTTFKHENIVHLYGVCTEGENWMLVFEFMEHGDLHGYLRSRAPDTVKIRDPDQPEVEVLTQPELLSIIKQIAKGLQFLTAQHFVHRDLATRNCLVGKDLTVKIGDFGLARDIYITDYYRIGNSTMLPYRWLALESIRFGKFTTKSDVWSFGVTMWEVFTYGQKPWCELSIPEMVTKIENGERLPCPQGCPESIYQLMVEGCWRLKEGERYDMTKICDILMNTDFKLPEYLDIVG